MNRSLRRLASTFSCALILGAVLTACATSPAGPESEGAGIDPAVSVVTGPDDTRTIVLIGIDGDRLVDPESTSGSIVVDSGCYALRSDYGMVMTLILPEHGGFTDDGLIDSTQGIYKIGENAEFFGEIVEPNDLSYAEELPTDCGDHDYLALRQISN